MNKIKALLLSAAVVFAISGAFATTDPDDPCLTQPLFRADNHQQVQSGYQCTNDPSKVCTYVEDPLDPMEHIPCDWGDYIPPPQN